MLVAWTEVENGQRHLWFSCPACQSWHIVPVGDRSTKKQVAWNGSLHYPSLGLPIQVSETCCFELKYGVMEYAPTCQHDRAGMKIALPELEKNDG